MSSGKPSPIRAGLNRERTKARRERDAYRKQQRDAKNVRNAR